jgi:hypothetical protein
MPQVRRRHHGGGHRVVALKTPCKAAVLHIHTAITTSLLSTSVARRGLCTLYIHFFLQRTDFNLLLHYLLYLHHLHYLQSCKMLFKSILLSGAVLALSAVNVSAHAAINPALGVKGTAVRNDVQRPAGNKPCGNAALTALDSSTAVKADASGSFTVDVENFNGSVQSLSHHTRY